MLMTRRSEPVPALPRLTRALPVVLVADVTASAEFFAKTLGFSIDFLRPARGRLLRARARVVRAGRTRVVCRCDLSTVDSEGAETLCAVAQGSIAVLEPVPA